MPTDAPQQTVTSHHVAKGLGTTVLARLGAVIEIIAQPLYVLMFGLTGFGVYAVLWAGIYLLENIFDLGMTSALQRTVPQSATQEEATAALRAALIFGVGPCLLVAVTIFFFAADIAPMFNVAAKDQALLIPAIKIFIWALPLFAFVEISTAAMRARLAFGPEIRLRVVWEQCLRLVFAGIFFAGGIGLKGLFIAHILSLAVTSILSLRLVSRYYDLSLLLRVPWGGTIGKETVQAGLSVLPANVIGRMFSEAPTLTLNLILPGAAGAVSAGLFTIARKLSSVVQLVRTAFAYVMAPLASSAARQDREQVADIYAYATRFITAVALPLALVLGAGSRPLLSLFGAEAQVAQTALIILLMARALESVMGISTPVLQVIAAFRHQLTAGVAGLIVAFITGWIAMDHLEPLTAVTLATATGMVVSSVIPALQLARLEKLVPFDSRYPHVVLRAFAVSACACVVAFGIGYLPDLLSVPLTVITAIATIWAALRFALPIEDRASLGNLGRKLRLAPKAL